MITSSYTNIAFISYKREDEEWAKWLQKKLEHYKLPTEIRKQNPDMEFAKNPRHVFKDTTDLSGGVLAKAIKEGLDSSKYLIVICSPRAAKSEWVCKEVQEFIDSGREEYIIPFIIDGEPYAKNPENECFPEALRALAGERELLGININENGRESAAVKVVARLFDLRFDTLWDRFQREQKRKRRIVVSAFIAAILFLLCIIAGGAYAYFEIQKERDRAEAETKRANEEKERATQLNRQLVSANNSITKQKTSLQQAYDDLSKTEKSLAQSNIDLSIKNAQLETEKKNVLKANWYMMENQSRAVAEKAKQKIADGEVYDAILALLEVLPDNKESSSKPYVPEAEQALRIALDSLNYSYVKQQISQDCYCYFSYGGNYLLFDNDSSFTIKDSETLMDKWNLSLGGKYNYIGCSDDDKYLEVGIGDKLFVYDFNDGKLCETLHVGEDKFSYTMQGSHPFYIYKDIDFEKYTPNILTQWFKPRRSNIQVVDYLPTKKLVLYKTANRVDDSYIDQIQTYSLHNFRDNKILWQQTDSVTIPADINNVCISHNGKYVVISRWHVIDLIDINTSKKETLDIFDASGHYSNNAFMSPDEKYLFQCCELDGYAHIYNTDTKQCIDSLHTFPLFPKSVSYFPNNSKYIINYFDWITTEQKSYMFVKPLMPIDISNNILPSLIKYKKNYSWKKEDDMFRFKNNKGVSWTTTNADFVGFSSDMQYIVVRKSGYRGVDVYEVLDINTGLCMYTEYIDLGSDENYINFLPYKDLLNISRRLTKNQKLSANIKKDFYL